MIKCNVFNNFTSTRDKTVDFISTHSNNTMTIHFVYFNIHLMEMEVYHNHICNYFAIIFVITGLHRFLPTLLILTKGTV